MPAPGDFTASDLVVIKVKMEEIWNDAAANKDFLVHADTAKAVMAEQTAVITPLKDKKKKFDVEIEWIEQCDMALDNDIALCDFPTPEQAQTNKEPYALTQDKSAIFKIGEFSFEDKTRIMEEVLPKQFLKAMKALDEGIAQYAVAAIDSFAGVNKYATGVGTVVGTNTFIQSAFWTADLMAYFAQASILNDYTNPFFLSGTNLFQSTWLAAMNNVNQDQKDELAKFATIRTHFDLFNLDSILAKQKTFLIDRGAVALCTRSRYDSTPRSIDNGADITLWSIPSQNLPGIMYDVAYKTVCSGDDIEHVYKVQSRFDVFLNPVNSCDTEQTGVLSFECGTAP